MQPSLFFLPTSLVIRLTLALIMLTYLVVAGLYAVRTPAWQTPDEPAHYNYVRQVAEGRLPIITEDDWDQAYLSALTSSRFAPALLADLGEIEYEDHQSPLYYVLAAPLFALTDGSLTALRVFSALIGVVIVICAYGIGRALYPGRPQIGLAAAAFVAFWPQHVLFLAAANNDSLGWAVVAVGLWAAVRFVQAEQPPSALLLGLIVGVALLTKATAYFLAGVLLAAVLLRHWARLSRSWGSDGGWSAALRPLARDLALVLIPALMLGGAWWLRNISVYGFPDFLGLGAHDVVVADQPRTSDAIAAAGVGAYLRDALITTLRSFFSQAGWMALPLPDPYYIAAYGAVGLALLGNIARRPRPDRAPVINGRAWGLLWLTIVLAILAYLYYNSEFLQLQGRYMFPLLIPLALLVALGIDGWLGLVMRGRSLSPTPAVLVTVLPFFALAAFDVWLLWRVIVPNLSA